MSIYKKKILFNGYYGYANTGDDSFIEVASWGAKNVWNKKDIFIHTNETICLPQLINGVKFYPEKKIRGQYRIQKYLAMKNAEAFITAGGSVFYKTFNQYDIKSTALRRKQKNKNVTVGAIGVSLGAFDNKASENFIRDYLRQIDFLALRDRRSYDIALSFNLPYKPIRAFDLAALLPMIYKYNRKIKSENERKIIGISLCDYSTSEAENKSRYHQKMDELISLITKEGNIFLRFFIFNGHEKNGDKDITFRTIEKLKQFNFYAFEILPYNPKTMSTWHKIADCDLMIATRLHAAIFACFAGVPFLLNEYHEKCSDFLSDVGQNEKYIIGNAEFDPGTIMSVIKEILFDHKFIYPLYTEEMQALAMKNFEETKSFFDAG